MRSLLLIICVALGMALPVLIYSLFGAAPIYTAGLVMVIALLCALCLAVERAAAIDAARGDNAD